MALATACTAGSSPGDLEGATDVASTDGSSTGASPSSSATGGPGTPPRCESDDDGWAGEGEDGYGEGSGTGGVEDTTFGMGDDMPLAVQIYEVQEGGLFPGDRIALTGVIVTSPSIRSETGWGYEVFVQEQEGGPYSGLRVRTGFDPSALFVRGQAVDLVGTVYAQGSYFLLDVADPTDVTPVSASVVPAPVLVSASDLEADDPAARPYDAVPVRIEEVIVTDAAPCEGEFVVDDAVRVDDRFVPAALPAPAMGQVITAVEGVLVFAFDSYELAPVDASGVQ